MDVTRNKRLFTLRALGAVVAATLAAAALSSCSSSGDPGIQAPTIQGAASSADLINAG
ncbi:hypothetical protein [Mycobacterium marinum]|uniref:hypothetical protein n=1 Tax=Mycobacterium marinum TaxID=1781 RepID=UPI003568C4C8